MYIVFIWFFLSLTMYKQEQKIEVNISCKHTQNVLN